MLLRLQYVVIHDFYKMWMYTLKNSKWLLNESIGSFGPIRKKFKNKRILVLLNCHIKLFA